MIMIDPNFNAKLTFSIYCCSQDSFLAKRNVLRDKGIKQTKKRTREELMWKLSFNLLFHLFFGLIFSNVPSVLRKQMIQMKLDTKNVLKGFDHFHRFPFTFG